MFIMPKLKSCLNHHVLIAQTNCLGHAQFDLRQLNFSDIVAMVVKRNAWLLHN